VSESASFYQVRGIRLKVNAARTPLSNMYLNALRNVGTVDAFVPLHIPIAAEPRLFIDEHDTATPNSRYQGETYFLTTAANRVEIKRFTANSITLAVSALAPDTLVVNQNWHRAWRTNRGVVVSHDGLLAVALEESGNYEVRLRYKPAGFYAGLAISLLALASVVALHSGLRPQTASPNLLTTWVAWPVAVEVPKWRFSLGSLSSPVRAAWAVGALWLLTALFSLFWQSAVSPMLTSDALLYNARKLAEAGQADEAIALLQRAALLRPKHPVVHHALGKLYNAKGAHLAAIGELRTALELDPEDYFSHRQLARAYGSLGWYVEAIAQAERARAIEPFEPAIFVDLAQFRAGAGQLDRALRDLERAAELGYDDLAELESLALLAPLRQSDRYRRVAETVHGRR
jgi:tetratricopeptide (TPR) repeat protein